MVWNCPMSTQLETTLHMAKDTIYLLQHANAGQKLLTTPLRDIVNCTRQSPILEQLAAPAKDWKATLFPNPSGPDAILMRFAPVESNVAEIGSKCLLLKLGTQIRRPKV